MQVVMVMPVIEQMTTVSQNGPVEETSAFCTAFGVRTGAEMMGAEPRPASLEKSPRATPVRMASIMQEPMKPPAAACSVKAQVQMRSMAGRMYAALPASTMMQPVM